MGFMGQKKFGDGRKYFYNFIWHYTFLHDRMDEVKFIFLLQKGFEVYDQVDCFGYRWNFS